MKYLKRTLAGVALCASLLCSAQQINPMTKAMLDAYTELLKENPKDYQTLYERAAQYYNLSRYDDAQNDLAKALEYTPAKEKALRLSELSLMADVAVETKNYELALKSVDEALELDPDNYAERYKKGNILLYLNKPEEAYRVFNGLQNLKSRSQEAYIGMAKACIMQKNYPEAETLMKEAENADPTNYLTYCRLGDLYLDMEQPENAATNYLVGFTMDNTSQRPLQSLISLASADYNAVATALDYAAEKADNNMSILFLKGNIACQSGNYGQADVALTQLLKYPEARAAGVYYQLGKAKLGQNDLAAAIEAANNSIGVTPSADAYVLKSKVELAQGKTAEALADADRALKFDQNDVDAMLAKAQAQIAGNDAKGALATLNEAVMVAPDSQAALLLRAYVNSELSKNAKGAVGDYNRIILEEATVFPEIAYKGIAQAKAGKKLDADSTVAAGLSGNPGKDAYYYAAVYYAQTGNLEKAKEMLDKAVSAGFQNQYALQSDNTPWFSLAPIRHLVK
ncbi:MAG: tetratricopeptide repeat protein [Bacteroides sp.]|nr:tetratricopeptide repeat protein [Bacteroides sp.]